MTKPTPLCGMGFVMVKQLLDLRAPHWGHASDAEVVTDRDRRVV